VAEKYMKPFTGQQGVAGYWVSRSLWYEQQLRNLIVEWNERERVESSSPVEIDVSDGGVRVQ
jgi:hypothetical protein